MLSRRHEPMRNDRVCPRKASGWSGRSTQQANTAQAIRFLKGGGLPLPPSAPANAHRSAIIVQAGPRPGPRPAPRPAPRKARVIGPVDARSAQYYLSQMGMAWCAFPPGRSCLAEVTAGLGAPSFVCASHPASSVQQRRGALRSCPPACAVFRRGRHPMPPERHRRPA